MHLLKICISQLPSLPDGQIRQLAHWQLAQPILFYSSGWIERGYLLPTSSESNFADVSPVVRTRRLSSREPLQGVLSTKGWGGIHLGWRFPRCQACEYCCNSLRWMWVWLDYPIILLAWVNGAVMLSTGIHYLKSSLLHGFQQSFSNLFSQFSGIMIVLKVRVRAWATSSVYFDLDCWLFISLAMATALPKVLDIYKFINASKLILGCKNYGLLQFMYT